MDDMATASSSFIYPNENDVIPLKLEFTAFKNFVMEQIFVMKNVINYGDPTNNNFPNASYINTLTTHIEYL